MSGNGAWMDSGPEPIILHSFIHSLIHSSLLFSIFLFLRLFFPSICLVLVMPFFLPLSTRGCWLTAWMNSILIPSSSSPWSIDSFTFLCFFASLFLSFFSLVCSHFAVRVMPFWPLSTLRYWVTAWMNSVTMRRSQGCVIISHPQQRDWRCVWGQRKERKGKERTKELSVDSLNEFSYDAEIAGLCYHLSPTATGLEVCERVWACVSVCESRRGSEQSEGDSVHIIHTACHKHREEKKRRKGWRRKDGRRAEEECYHLSSTATGLEVCSGEEEKKRTGKDRWVDWNPEKECHHLSPTATGLEVCVRTRRKEKADFFLPLSALIFTCVFCGWFPLPRPLHFWSVFPFAFEGWLIGRLPVFFCCFSIHFCLLLVTYFLLFIASFISVFVLISFWCSCSLSFTWRLFLLVLPFFFLFSFSLLCSVSIHSLAVLGGLQW